MRLSVSQLRCHFIMDLKEHGVGLVVLVVIVLLDLSTPVEPVKPGIPETDISVLYNMYKEAAGDENIRSASRRVFKDNREYLIHVKRLKGVNGFKPHNLIIRTGGQPHVNKTMYINNPVESQMPQSFLSLDEFKQALINEVQKRKEIMRTNTKSKLTKTWKVKRKGRNQIRTRMTKNVKQSAAVGSSKTVVKLYSKSMNITTIKHRLQVTPILVTRYFTANVTIPLITNDKLNKKQKITTESISSYKNVTKEYVTKTIDTTPEMSITKELNLNNDSAAESETMGGEIIVTDEVKAIGEVTDTEVITDKPATERSAEIEVLTTKSTRATLGRPAVYMGY